MSDREQRIATLEARLQDGWGKIGQAYAHGIDVANWEVAWVDLLRQYERLSDELAAARPEQAGLPGVSRGRGAA